MSSNIIVLGSVNVDLVVRGNGLPRAGETITGGEFFKAQGGKGANQAVAAKRLANDASVTFLGAVGDDMFGNESRSALATEGIDVSELHTMSDTPTGVALIMVDSSGSGENQISVASGANSKVDGAFVKNVDDEVFRSAGVFVASLEVGIEAVRRGLERARQHGAYTILNPAPVMTSDRECVLDLLPLVDLLIPNHLEAQALCDHVAGSLDSSKMADHLSAASPKMSVIITLGSDGCVLRTPDEPAQSIPAASTATVIDTTAAGDCFCGAIAAEVANGSELRDTCYFATRAAGICVTRLGAQPSIPYRSEL